MSDLIPCKEITWTHVLAVQRDPWNSNLPLESRRSLKSIHGMWNEAKALEVTRALHQCDSTMLKRIFQCVSNPEVAIDLLTILPGVDVDHSWLCRFQRDLTFLKRSMDLGLPVALNVHKADLAHLEAIMNHPSTPPKETVRAAKFVVAKAKTFERLARVTATFAVLFWVICALVFIYIIAFPCARACPAPAPCSALRLEPSFFGWLAKMFRNPMGFNPVWLIMNRPMATIGMIIVVFSGVFAIFVGLVSVLGAVEFLLKKGYQQLRS